MNGEGCSHARLHRCTDDSKSKVIRFSLISPQQRTRTPSSAGSIPENLGIAINCESIVHNKESILWIEWIE